jgi:hypothetical protein
MADREQLIPILRQLLDLHAACAALGEHEIAFHSLSAAAHAAESMADIGMLDRISAMSREELAWLDANDPHHRLSTRSAAARRHQSIFEHLGVTAATMSQRVHAEQVRRAAAEHPL